MRGGHLDMILRHLRHLLGAAPGEHSDGRLLERFLERRDEDAFAALVARHGPMVWNVCRRRLSEADAEDAFQATFLVLVRRASSLDRRGSLAGWLHEVAVRVSLRARAGRERERPLTNEEVPAMNATDPANAAERKELRTLIDEVLRTLPEKYRGPVLLCDVQGRSHEEAARQLGYPIGSMSWRLARGRELLRRGLERRGVTLSAAMLAALLGEEAVAMPAVLADATVRTAVLLATGGAGALRGSVAALVDGTVRALGLGRLKVFVVVALFGLMATGLTFATYKTLTADRASTPPADDRADNKERPTPPIPPAKEDEKNPQPAAVKPAPLMDRQGDPLPPGAIARLGTLRLRQADGIAAFAFSPDSKILATGGGNNDAWLHLWDTETGKLVRRLPEHGVTAIAFSPDRKLLAVASRLRTNNACIIRFWDLGTGLEWQRITDPDVIASRLVFTSDGKTLVGVGAVRLAAWDVATRNPIPIFAEAAEQVSLFTVAPDSKHIAAISADSKTAFVTAIATTTRREFTRQGSSFSAIAYSPDGKHLAVGTPGVLVSLLDPETMKVQAELEKTGDSYILALGFSADSKELLVFDQTRRIQVCDAATGRHLRWCVQPAGRMRFADFSPDGKLAAILNHDDPENEYAVRLLDLATGKDRFRIDGHESGVRSLSFSPDGKSIASTGMDCVTIVWDVADVRQKWSVGGKYERPGAVAFDPSGRWVAACGDSGCVELFDAATGRSRTNLGEDTRSARDLAFSPDGKTLAVLAGRWLSFGPVDEPRDALKDGIRAVSSVAVDRAGRWAAAVPKGALVSRLTRKGEPEQISLGAVADTTYIALAPDGAALAVGSGDDETIHIFDPDTLKERRPLQHALRLADESLRCLALSSSGQIMATGGAEGSVRLFDTTTGAELLRLDGHEGPVQTIAFSADGRLLASASSDTTVLIWDLARVWSSERRPGHVPALAALWTDLDNPDGAVALRAAAAIEADPAATVAFFREQLKPVPADHAERLKRAVADLQDEDYEVRDRALAELRSYGSEAIPPLRQLQRTATDPKLQTRLRAFLTWAETEGIGPPREVSREVLAVQALERIGTPEARLVLEKVAQGAPSAPLTEAARAALRRMQ